MVELRLDGLMLLTFKKCKKHFPSGNQWKKLTRVVIVETTREAPDFSTQDRRFYISSCDASAELLLHPSRTHWDLENSLHWTLDVTFREDASPIQQKRHLKIMRFSNI